MASKKAKIAKASKPVKGAAKNEMRPPHRTSNAAPSAVVHRTTAEINVSEKHSLELARTVMTATISTIVSLRGIFDRRLFAIRTYDCADPEFTYEAFMNGSSGKIAFERSEDTLNWKVLSRTTADPAANKLLDWIEVAATDALGKKYLAKLQLSFHSVDGQDVSDANIIEAYNICFTYENDQMSVGTAIGSHTVANSVVLRGAKKDLYTLVNDVAVMIQERNPLPADRRMNMMLLYNNTCPSDYEPPGFHPNLDPKRLIATNKGAELGSMNTGFHGVSVNLFQQDPQNRQNGQPCSKRRRFRLRSPSMSSEIDGGGTQEDGLRLLQGMGKHRVPETTQDTQLINGTATQSSDPGALLPSQKPTPAFLLYSQTVMERINQMREQKGAAHWREYDLNETCFSDRLVTCECGALSDEERDLIQCDLCDNFKHIQCYGCLSPVPPASKFACYTCLLNIEGGLLSQMKVTCVKRRILHYLHRNRSSRSIEDLAQYLDRDKDTAEDILCELERDGYVKRAVDYEKLRKGKGTSTEPLFTLVADDHTLLSSFFRPEMNIPHKLLLPSSPGSATISENVNEDSGHDMTLSSITFVPEFSRGCTSEATTSAQAALAEASSTEGTPSPYSASARRHSAYRNQIQPPNACELSLGGSHPGRKRPYDSIPEPELAQSIQHGVLGLGTGQEVVNRTKISVVNSPWTFRSIGNFSPSKKQ